MYGFFDKVLKGEKNTRLDKMPRVTYYTMGLNKWQTSNTWPPEGAQPMTFFLSSGGRANTMTGDGVLTPAPPDADRPDHFTYDPMKPVTSYGGNVCCTGNAVQAGAFDQRKMETRDDILVFTSEPFTGGVELSGPITPTLYVSSDAKDTDFTVKVLDVYPDGRAYNLDESIQRMPDGRSTATTGMPEPLMSATTVSSIPWSGVLRPVPKIASTIRSHDEISEKCSSQV